MSPPTGTVTFVFTDIEGSTRLWDTAPDAMRPALARHDALVRRAIETHDGFVFKTVGDAFCAAFATANAALSAAVDAQLALAGEPWALPSPLRVRMALHTGACEEHGGDYFGPPLNRVARLLEIGHGGQVLLSHVTRGLVLDDAPPRAGLAYLGEHRLRDLGRPERVFQLRHEGLLPEFPPLRSLDNPGLPNNLPQPVTTFIGREQEMVDVPALLQRSRLVTLTGGGGAGKTRLSLQVAAGLLDRFADGVWLVELAPLAEGPLVPQAVAEALHVREQAGQTLTATLREFLLGKELLLVLDNCEHVLADCAALVTDILRACPKVKILTSSREALNVSGEQTSRVPSLSLADPRRPQTAEALSQYDAVTLFLQRAQAVQPAFTVTDANAPAVAQICWRLDGIPLAIELAAARLRALPVEQVMARLNDRFKLLTGGSRTALPRQQTLRALVDWSYDLLSDQEKRLLRRLSVFSGGWTLEATESVCAGEGLDDFEILDLLTQLIDKSLVQFEEHEGQGRYRLLETLREYSHKRLQDAQEGDVFRRRHRDWCLALAEQAEPVLRGPRQLEWLDRLELEYGNLRAGMEWSATQAEETEPDARLVTALWHFWWIRGHFTEGRERLMTLLQRRDIGTGLEARARVVAGLLSYFQYDFSTGTRLVEEGTALARRAEDPWLLGFALIMEGFTLSQVDTKRAASSLEEAVAISRAVNDRWLIAEALSTQGHLEIFYGDRTRAKVLFAEGLNLCRESGSRWLLGEMLLQSGFVAGVEEDWSAARLFFEESLLVQRELSDQHGQTMSLNALGHIALRQSDLVRGSEFFQECLTITNRSGNLQRLAYPLDGLASVALAHGDAKRSLTLFAAAAAIRSNIPLPSVFWKRHIDMDKDRLQVTLSGEDHHTAKTHGEAMTVHQAVSYAFEGIAL